MPGLALHEITSDDLFRDISAAFLDTYASVVGANQYLPMAMQLGMPSSKRVERHGYSESPPTVDRVDIDQPISEDSVRMIAYEIANLDWGKAVGFREADLEDLSIGDLRQFGRQLAERAAEIPEEVLFQIMTGSASSRLLATIPTAPDGAALYATTAGGAARFGVTGGNILTGSGVSAGKDISSDLQAVFARWLNMQDTEGQKLIPTGVIDRPVLIIAGASNLGVFEDAFEQRIQSQVFGSNTAAAGISNIHIDKGRRVILWLTQKITDNDWFVFADAPGVGPKPLVEQMRRPPQLDEINRSNSRQAVFLRVLEQVLFMRAGYGLNLPYLTIKVNN